MGSKILFRVNAGYNVGFGHIVRCVALAEELIKKTQMEALFITNNFTDINKLNREGYRCFALPDTLSQTEYDMQMQSILADNKPTIVVNDILDTQVEYVQNLKKNGAKVVNLDDLGPGRLYADKVIISLRNIMNSQPGPNHLIGPEYMVLRKDFAELRKKQFRKKIREQVKNVLILSSGSEPAGLIGRWLGALSKIANPLNITIVAFSQERLNSSMGDYIPDGIETKIVFDADAQTLISLMQDADVGVTGCGVGAYEMACTGLPVLTSCKSDFEVRETIVNQYGFVVHTGLASAITEAQMLEAVSRVFWQKDLRTRLSKEGMKTVDGQGLYRVIDVLVNLLRA